MPIQTLPECCLDAASDEALFGPVGFGEPMDPPLTDATRPLRLMAVRIRCLLEQADAEATLALDHPEEVPEHLHFLRMLLERARGLLHSLEPVHTGEAPYSPRAPLEEN